MTWLRLSWMYFSDVLIATSCTSVLMPERRTRSAGVRLPPRGFSGASIVYGIELWNIANDGT